MRKVFGSGAFSKSNDTKIGTSNFGYYFEHSDQKSRFFKKCLYDLLFTFIVTESAISTGTK